MSEPNPSKPTVQALLREDALDIWGLYCDPELSLLALAIVIEPHPFYLPVCGVYQVSQGQPLQHAQ